MSRSTSKQAVLNEITLLKVEEVAEVLRISVWEVYRMASRGDLDKVKIGRRVRVPASAVRRYIAMNTEEAA